MLDMSKKSSIVVYLDATSINRNVLHYCGNIAKAMKKKLCYFNVHNTPSLALNKAIVPATNLEESAIALADNLIKESKERLEEAVTFTKSVWSDVTSDFEVGFGLNDISTKLEDLKEKIKGVEFLIAVRNKYDTETADWMQSRLASIITQTKVPVMVIPKHEPYKDIKKISYVLEEGELPIEDLKLCARIASGFDAELEILYVTSPENKYYQAETAIKRYQIKENLNYDNVVVRKFLTEDTGSAYNMIMISNHSDMLAFNYQGVPFFRRLIDGSPSEKIVSETNIPVLAF